MKDEKVIIASVPEGVEKKGVIILFHGLTGSPDELSQLAVKLSECGYETVVPCLPGHLATVEELRQIPQQVFEQFCIQHVKQREGSISFVGGLSFGGILALRAALEMQIPPKGIILIAPPFRLRATSFELMLGAVGLLPDSVRGIFGFRKKVKRELPLPRRAYDHYSISAAARMVAIRSKVWRKMGSLGRPVLIIQDPADHLVSPEGAERAMEKFDGSEVDCIWIPGGEHELTLGHHADQAMRTVVEFVKRVGGTTDAT